MRYFPIFMDIKDKPVLVVGGGDVASRKVEALLRAGARVTLLTPELKSYLKSLVKSQKCEWIKERYQASQLSRSYIQVWATTNDRDLNHMIFKDAHQLGLLVNVVDDQPFCDFITPSMISRGRIQLAISSGGASPVLIRNVRQTIESVLPQNLSLLADFGALKRDDIKVVLPSVDLRRQFWEAFYADRRVAEANDIAELESLYHEIIQDSEALSADCTLVFYSDDVELLPMKAIQYMQKADLIITVRNCPEEYVELSRRDADKKQFESIDELKSMLSEAFHQSQKVCVFIPELEKDAYINAIMASRCFFSAVMM
jgi:precorrin-2 dehydrogenase / sirohydrochlorin ferrochelatase